MGVWVRLWASRSSHFFSSISFPQGLMLRRWQAQPTVFPVQLQIRIGPTLHIRKLQLEPRRAPAGADLGASVCAPRCTQKAKLHLVSAPPNPGALLPLRRPTCLAVDLVRPTPTPVCDMVATSITCSLRRRVQRWRPLSWCGLRKG